jgi:hypothetical protein
LALCGYDPQAPEWVVERREQWLAAAPHDKRPGETAVADVDSDLLIKSLDQIRVFLGHANKVSKSDSTTA